MHEDQAMKTMGEYTKVWQEAFNAGNAKRIASLYTETAIFSSGPFGVLKGRDNIEKAISELIASGIKLTDLQCKAVTNLNDDAFSGAGDFCFTMPDETKLAGYWGTSYVKHQDKWFGVLHVSNRTIPT